MPDIHKITLALCLLIGSTTLTAQSTEAVWQRQIDSLVWEPFITSYNQLDAENFNRLHSDQVLRAGSRSIRIGEEYKEANRNNFARSKNRNSTRKISLRFDFRKTTPELSYETGFYKVVSRTPGEEPKSYYGYFHVLIRKIDGQWKIVQDWDDEQINGKAVGEEDFMSARESPFLSSQ